MTFHFLFVFALLKIVFAGSLGAEHEEAYWKSVFPNNIMPRALKDILPRPVSKSLKGPNAPTNLRENHENNKWKVQLSNPMDRTPRFYVDDWTLDSKGNHENNGWKVQLPDSINRTPSDPRMYVGDWTVDSKGNHDNREEQRKEFKVETSNSDDLSKNSGTIKVSNNNHGNYKNSTNGSYVHSIADYSSPENKEVSKVHNSGGLIKSFFFLQKDIHRGMLVNHTSLITSDKTPFLSDQIVKSLPFSSNKLPEILNHFSLKLGTIEADAVKDTIRGCERVTMKGEEKFCATSFESLIDLSVLKLGKQIQLLSNELSRETKDPLFMIGRGIRNMGENQMICHKMDYPGAVFLCHTIAKTIVYKVPLVGRDGTKANALAVCHKDTSAWNPKHMAFQVLKLKPGTVPICHFLVRDTIVWVSN